MKRCNLQAANQHEGYVQSKSDGTSLEPATRQLAEGDRRNFAAARFKETQR